MIFFACVYQCDWGSYGGVDDGKPRGKRSFWRPWKAEQGVLEQQPMK